MKLNLGCGSDYIEGYMNVDNNINYKADRYFDLNKIPYPLPDNTFKEITMNMILEHLDKPIEVLNEICRISKDEAKIKIIVPHATTYSNFVNIQHEHLFTEISFDDFLLEAYRLNELKLIKNEFIYNNKWKKYIPFKNYLKLFII